MNNQTFKIHWRIAADLPAKEGWYLGITKRGDGFFWDDDLEFYRFLGGEWETMEPDFWTEIPLPKD